MYVVQASLCIFLAHLETFQPGWTSACCFAAVCRQEPFAVSLMSRLLVIEDVSGFHHEPATQTSGTGAGLQRWQCMGLLSLRSLFQSLILKLRYPWKWLTQ